MVALITAPAVVVWLNQTQGWAWYWSILAALLVVVCFRGVVRPHLPPLHPAAEPLRAREPAAARGGRRRAPSRVVLALLAEDRGRRGRRRRLLLPDRRSRLPRSDPAAPPDLPLLHAHELRDPLRPAAHHEPLADPGLRARRRRVGRQARRRPRTGGGEGGSPPGGLDLAVRRGVRARGRQARARAPLPRRAGHRQDDAGEGARDGLQLAVHLDSRVGLRRHLHRHRRDRRPHPRPPCEAPRTQVGRPVHRLHRRDRRRRHASAGAEPRLRRHGRRLTAPGRARPPLLRPVRCAQPVRRPHPREPPVARAALRATARRSLPVHPPSWTG